AVSEERGEVSIADHGALAQVPDASTLARRLAQLASPAPAPPARRPTLVRDAIVGAGIFVAVVAAWNAVAHQRDASGERTVPVQRRGVPAGAHYESVPSEATLQLRGPRRLLVGLGADELHARADITANGDVPVLGIAPPGVEVAAVVPTRVTIFERRALRVEP